MEWNVDNPDIVLIPTSGSSEAFSLIGKENFILSTIVIHKKLITQTRSWENYVKHQEGTRSPEHTAITLCFLSYSSWQCVCVQTGMLLATQRAERKPPHSEMKSRTASAVQSVFSEGGEEVACTFSPRCGK